MKYHGINGLLYLTGSLGEDLVSPDVFPYSSIPNFPVSTVDYHKGQLVFGLLAQVPVVCMQGRFHYYEGYDIHTVRNYSFI